jgi:hypothetical protein
LNTMFILANGFYVRHVSTIFQHNVHFRIRLSKRDLCQTCIYNTSTQCSFYDTTFMSDMYLQFFNTMFMLANGFYVRHVSTIFEYNFYLSKHVLCQTYIYNIWLQCLHWHVFYLRHVSTIFEYNVYFSKQDLCQTCIYNISTKCSF